MESFRPFVSDVTMKDRMNPFGYKEGRKKMHRNDGNDRNDSHSRTTGHGNSDRNNRTISHDKNNVDVQSFFQRHLNLRNRAVLRRLEENSFFWNVQNRELIIQQGAPLKEVPFLLSGAVKGYYQTEEGQQRVACFGYLKGDVIVGAYNLSSSTKSLMTIETIGKCSFICVSTDCLLQLMEEFTEVMRLYTRILSLAYHKAMEHERILVEYKARERYQYFADTYGDLLDVVNKKDIASYLNLAPESLSRVLKECKEETLTIELQKQSSIK